MDAPLRASIAGPLEVLHGVRDVDVVAIDAGGVERAVEQLPRGSDEWVAGLVLLVARLFANDDHARARRSFAEDRLGPDLEQVAPATTFRRGPQL